MQLLFVLLLREKKERKIQYVLCDNVECVINIYIYAYSNNDRNSILDLNTLIYKIYNQPTPPCLEHLIQRKESKYDLRHQDRVSL